jgi:hypothetical protein
VVRWYDHAVAKHDASGLVARTRGSTVRHQEHSMGHQTAARTSLLDAGMLGARLRRWTALAATSWLGAAGSDLRGSIRLVLSYSILPVPEMLGLRLLMGREASNMVAFVKWM